MKLRVERDVLDNILNNPPKLPNGRRINTYAQAAQYYYALDPEKFDQFRKATEEEGFKKGQQKKKKFLTNRRAKPASTGESTIQFKQYLTDEGKLDSPAYNRLPVEKQLEIADKWVEHLQKQQKG